MFLSDCCGSVILNAWCFNDYWVIIFKFASSGFHKGTDSGLVQYDQAMFLN